MNVFVNSSYLMNALSSFCRDTPVYWAITIDLKPVAFKPFAQIPQIPHVDLIDTLNTYGDADSTESTSASVCAFCPSAGVVSTLTVCPDTILVPIALATKGTS